MVALLVVLVLAVPTVVGGVPANGNAAHPQVIASSALEEAKPPPESSDFCSSLWTDQDFWRNVILALVAIGGFYFAIRRARTADRQATAALDQAKAANEQAKAANEQAKAANEQAKAANEQTKAANEQAAAANEQVNVAEQGLVTDRFSKALNHLESKVLTVRVGGIRALWRMTEDSSDQDVVRAIDTLCTFACHPPHREDDFTAVDYPREEFAILVGPGRNDLPFPNESDKHESFAIPRIRADVLAVMKLIGKTNADHDLYFARAFLINADFRGLAFVGADFVQANLWKANLGGADMTNANFTKANLGAADLSNTNFTGAKLAYANLMGVRPTKGVNFKGAILTQAIITGADLRGAKYLTQKQLNGTCYHPSMRPKLPSGRVAPEPRPGWETLPLPPFFKP